MNISLTTSELGFEGGVSDVNSHAGSPQLCCGLFDKYPRSHALPMSSVYRVTYVLGSFATGPTAELWGTKL
jgi:hypothetical protein